LIQRKVVVIKERGAGFVKEIAVGVTHVFGVKVV
jgi:hypothetical protein